MCIKVCLTIVTWILIATFRPHTAGLHQAIVSIYWVELFVPPWLLVIGVSQTSLMVRGFQSKALLALWEEEKLIPWWSFSARRFLWALNLLAKRHVETSRREEEMGRVKGSGEGAGREKVPLPLSFFRPRTYRKGYYFYSPQSSTVIKIKDSGYNNFARTRW